MDIDALIDGLRALPGTTEAPHHHLCSARVNGKIYATWPTDGSRVHLFVDDATVHAAVAAGIAEELWWGKKLSGVRIELTTAGAEDVLRLAEVAWRRKGGRRA